MKKTLVAFLVFLLVVLVGCAGFSGSDVQSSIISIVPGDNIKLTPNPIVLHGTVDLVDNPVIKGDLNVSGTSYFKILRVNSRPRNPVPPVIRTVFPANSFA